MKDFNNRIQINMNYYCSVFDKTIKLNSKNSHFETLMHIQYEKFIRKKTYY